MRYASRFLAWLESIKTAAAAPKGAISIVVGDATACLEVAGLIDVAAEVARLKKETGKLEGEVAGIDKKLANEQFVAKAPPEIIEEQHERRAAAVATHAKLTDALKQLQA